MLSPQQVVGVLVTYQPDAAVAQRITKHLEQVSQLIIVDNGASKPSDILPTGKNITLLAHAQNNLGAAQNLGILAAKEQGAKAVLLLDDDSELSDGALAALCEALGANDALAAPQLMIGGQAQRQASPYLRLLFKRGIPKQGAPLQRTFTPIASGSLIALWAIEQAGLMDESFGIDYIDRDFCLRLLQRGYGVKVIAEASLTHQLGNSKNTVLGIVTRGHAPSRRRSIFRNRMRCWGRYGLCFPSFLIYDVMAACYDVFRIIALEDNKRQKLHAALEGAIDAITGRQPTSD